MVSGVDRQVGHPEASSASGGDLVRMHLRVIRGLFIFRENASELPTDHLLTKAFFPTDGQRAVLEVKQYLGII